ncbi:MULTISPECIES: hypothetical protein [Hymenobacter]|uniref:Uncharacterized protein n=1 Tax=Hymenobacter mucosus TaxID=1411120 RepID=A0A239AXG6_9BACT|nr:MULTISPECIES: hypothetical protein [Hymenobacter]MDF7815534.1 hypothetical protein [Hymenobacter sp. YC55]SNS00426.1 hypothetical protein SAMN06269173_11631 [Hymenobacter mucosus]
MDFSKALAHLPGALYFSFCVGLTTFLALYVYRFYLRPFFRWTKKKISPNG